MPLRGRLAPSPTGVLHLGNARSFLLAWLSVRARGGAVVLRIEDLDGPRNRQGAAQAAVEDLRWLGLDWDEGPYEQASRLHDFEAALEQLRSQGLAYPCTCTRKDVEAAASAPHAGDEGPIYPGTCRGRYATAEEARLDSGREPCWRFAVPAGEVVDYVDGFCGPQSWPVDRRLGDFVIWKRDGQPAYQLAVVVDDAEQGITEVLRGDDLLPSTPRQILLYRALRSAVPQFSHVPLVIGDDGRRLAKRHGDTTLKRFRDQGVPADRLLGALAHWSGLQESPRPTRAQDLIESFDLQRVPQDPVVWNGRLPHE